MPILFRYHCGSCDFTFKVPELSEAYGEFIMRSNKTDDSVYLNSFDDMVFDEVANLFKTNEVVKNTHKLDDADFFQSIFSISCDLASDGSQYQIGLMPVCPNCGSRNMISWGPTNPPEFLAEEMKTVKHECWNKLTDEEKRNLLNEAVKTYLKK